MIVCVSTGDEKKLVLGHVEQAVRQTIHVLRNENKRTMPIVMVYSTLPFGSSKKLREVFREEGVELDGQVGYVHFPLMIAQGTTAEDFVNPPFVVFGSYGLKSAGRARSFYGQFIKRSSLYSGKLPPMFSGTPEEAELAKLSANAYLTTKIAVANEIGSLCEQLNMDGQKVMQIVGSDWRIGRKFTRPGYAVGGQCFPRDLKSLIKTFRDSRVEPRILEGVDVSNEARILDPLGKIEGQKVMILGTSYKEGVKDERGSQVQKLIEHLRAKGYSVTTYDPKLSNASDMSANLKSHNAIIITIPERSFRRIGKSLVGQAQVVLDYANVLEAESIPRGVRLWQAGRGWVRAIKARN